MLDLDQLLSQSKAEEGRSGPPRMTQIFFDIMAGIVIIGALGVVLVRSIVYAALFLIMSLMGVAGLYILLSVEFLALVQVLIYGGAVTVLSYSRSC